jgi:hypothetical protein
MGRQRVRVGGKQGCHFLADIGSEKRLGNEGNNFVTLITPCEHRARLSKVQSSGNSDKC